MLTGPSIAVTTSSTVIRSGNRAIRSPPCTPRTELRNPARRSGTTMRLMNFSEMPCDAAISLMVRGPSFPLAARSSRIRSA